MTNRNPGFHVYEQFFLGENSPDTPSETRLILLLYFTGHVFVPGTYDSRRMLVWLVLVYARYADTHCSEYFSFLF